MNHLRSLSSKGRPGPLEAYKSKKTKQAKDDFTKSLSLDFDAAFVEATESASLGHVKRFKGVQGWAYLWTIAKEEGLEYKPVNLEILKSLCNAELGDEAGPHRGVAQARA